MALIGYQFDRMKVSPEADALLYFSLLDGNDRIIKNYKEELSVVATGLNIYVSTGAAIIQGRMVEVDEEEQLTVSANDSGYICIVVDLTQNNTSTGTPGSDDYEPINNQLRLEVVKDLVQQDLHNGGQLYTFPLASYTSTGTSVTVTRINHNKKIVESGSNSNGRYIKYADGTLECYQTINLGKTIYGAGSFGNPYRTETKNWTFPYQFIDTNIALSTTGRISSEDAMQRACICSGNQLSATRLDQVQIATLSTATTTSDAFAHLKAIGRWKV